VSGLEVELKDNAVELEEKKGEIVARSNPHPPPALASLEGGLNRHLELVQKADGPPSLPSPSLPSRSGGRRDDPKAREPEAKGEALT
jgi:hypothetical protein